MSKFCIILVALNLVIFNAKADAIPTVFEGRASYYANSLHGNKTASGVPYDKNKLTAAHRKLPFGTKVKVTYLKTGKSVLVTINDRGPHVKGRIIDLSAAAARKIGLIKAGLGKVKIEIIQE